VGVWLATSVGSELLVIVLLFGVVCLVVAFWNLVQFANGGDGDEAVVSLYYFVLTLLYFLVAAVVTRSVREYLVAVLCCRSRDRFDRNSCVAPRLAVVLGAAVVQFIGFLVCLILAAGSSWFGDQAMTGVFFLLLPVALSHIVREHVVAVLCCRSRDSLDYTWHCTCSEPMFRLRAEPEPNDAAALQVPPCFLLGFLPHEDEDVSLLTRAR
jgi:hypothetical protein